MQGSIREKCEIKGKFGLGIISAFDCGSACVLVCVRGKGRFLLRNQKLLFEISSPALEKTLPHGTDEAGIQKHRSGKTYTLFDIMRLQ